MASVFVKVVYSVVVLVYTLVCSVWVRCIQDLAIKIYQGVVYLILVQAIYSGKEQTYLRSRELEKRPKHICFAFQRVRGN